MGIARSGWLVGMVLLLAACGTPDKDSGVTAPATTNVPGAADTATLKGDNAQTSPAESKAAGAADTVALKGDNARTSYAVGYNTGSNIKRIAGELDIAAVVEGVRDAYLKGKPQMEPEELQQRLQQFQQDVMRRDQARRQAESARNMAEGEAFRKANAARPGVKVTPSGLQYNVLREGKGPRPKPSDRVRVHYHGTLIDGSVFDSSVERGQPITFRLDGLIPGWVEGLQLMKVGSKYRFVIPPELAYGKRGSPPKIGPDATLIFEVELLGIEK